MISTLIGLVVALIAAAQQPNVPVHYKVAALTLANQIIVLAEQQSTAPAAVTADATPTVMPPPAIPTAPQPAPVSAPAATVTQTTGVAQPPSCSITATTTTDAAFWLNTYASNPPTVGPVQLAWDYPDGATGVISNSSGGVDTLHTAHNPTYGAASLLEVMPKGFAPQNAPYTLTVTQDGLTSTCQATL